jgi:signal transduction histidine kinase
MDDNVTSALFKTITDEAMVGILILDAASNKLVYANNLCRDMFEFPMSLENEKFDIASLCPEKSEDIRQRSFSIETLKMQGIFQEITMQRMNRTRFIATVGVKRINIEQVPHTLLMIQDITLQKKLQRELTEKQAAIHQAYTDLLGQNKALKELDLAKDKFIAMTTHELRTPAGAMFASAEVLKMKTYDTQEEHDSFVDTIYDQGKHLLTLVNDILDFAKIQAGKMDYYVEEKDVYQLVVAQVAMLDQMAKQANISVKIVSAEEEIKCYFDELRLSQVAINLINNAIKYNKPNGEVKINIISTDHFVAIMIEDTGKGISAENLPKVFNEFETLGSVSNHSKGTGLGLPISKRMIEAMGGKINIRSEVGVGSTFTIEVPKKKVLPEEHYRSRQDQSGDLLDAV